MGTRRLNRRCGRRRRPWRTKQPLQTLHDRGGGSQRPGKLGGTSLTAALQRPSMAARHSKALRFTERGGGPFCGVRPIVFWTPKGKSELLWATRNGRFTFHAEGSLALGWSVDSTELVSGFSVHSGRTRSHPVAPDPFHNHSHGYAGPSRRWDASRWKRRSSVASLRTMDTPLPVSCPRTSKSARHKMRAAAPSASRLQQTGGTGLGPGNRPCLA